MSPGPAGRMDRPDEKDEPLGDRVGMLVSCLRLVSNCIILLGVSYIKETGFIKLETLV